MLLKNLVIGSLKDNEDCLDQGFIQEDDPVIDETHEKQNNFSGMIIDNDEIYNINKVNDAHEMINKQKNEFLSILLNKEKESLNLSLSSDKKIIERKNYLEMMQKISDLSVKSKEMTKYKKFSKKKQKNKKKA